MSRLPVIAVMHDETSFFPLPVFQAAAGHSKLVWVADETTMSDRGLVRTMSRLGKMVDIAGCDVDEAALRLGRESPDGIVCFVDRQLRRTAQLAERLGLRFHSPAVAEVLADKALQRVALSKSGIAQPNFVVLAAGWSVGDAARALSEVGLPAVVKPIEGSGSRDVVMVGDLNQVVSLSSSRAYRRGMIVEEYMLDDPTLDERIGSYLSVESAVSSGEISHLAITGRFPLSAPFRESGFFIPALLHQEVESSVTALVDSTIPALGITDSTVHTEVKLTPDGPKIIEVNGRIGGPIPFLLSSVSAVSMFQVAFQLAVGEFQTHRKVLRVNGVGFHIGCHLPVEAKVVKGLRGVQEIAGIDGITSCTVDKPPGSIVDWRDGTSSKVVSVYGRVNDHDSMFDAVAKIKDTLVVDYEV
ncbi:MAG: ATP-grasp domain-containing protein [Acidimicrobiales bacterium]